MTIPGRVHFVEPPFNTGWSPLSAPGWIAFNRERWGLAGEAVRISKPDGGPSLMTVLYRDSRGRIVSPPHTPYLPVRLDLTAVGPAVRLTRQRLLLSSLFAEIVRSYGTKGWVALEPTLADVRPFQWLAFDVEPRFTYYVDLPSDPESWNENVQKKCRLAERLGYSCERTDDLTAVAACLRGSEQRQGFTYGLSLDDLRRCRTLVGDGMRCYLCLGPGGRPASARVNLHMRGTRAVDFMAGTDPAHLQSGATQLVIAFVLDDLARAGATGFDFAGANIQAVARAKADWGGELTPFYAVRAPGARSIVDATLRAFDLGRKWTVARGKRRMSRPLPG